MLATFWHGLTVGTTYYRCDLPARHLPGVSQMFDVTDLKEGEDGEPVFPRQQGDVAVWQFAGTREAGILMAAMQDQGVKVLMETDDNNLRSAPGAGRDYVSGWTDDIDDPDKPSHPAHRRITEFSDGVICSTPYLAERYKDANNNVFVCRNAVDPADWPPPPPEDGRFRIGWSASTSHLVDAPLVRRALRWASKQKDVQVILLGLRPPGWDFRCVHVPWTTDLRDYRHNLGFLDVGVCPLIDSEWAKSKSDIKAVEYAMAGALPIVSRAEAYRPWWETKMPCLVAETAGGFEEAVRWAVSHRDEVKQLALAAGGYVLAERAYPAAVQPWRDVINTVTSEPEKSRPVPSRERAVATGKV